jgi:hypothetical protein
MRHSISPMPRSLIQFEKLMTHTCFRARSNALRRDGAREPQLKFFQTGAVRKNRAARYEPLANLAHSPSLEGCGSA